MVKFLNSFKYAFKGIILNFKEEANFRFHLFVALQVIAAAFYLHLDTVEFAIVCICIGLVLSAEAINTAIENLTDLVSPEKHELAEKTKDSAAAAVLIISIAAAIVGLIIFVPKLIALFNG